MPVATLVDQIAPLSNPAGVRLRPFDASTLSGANMKGFALLHNLEAMKGARGEAYVREWQESLPASLAGYRDLRAVTSVGWLPVEAYFSSVAYRVEHEYAGDVRSAIRIGYENAQHDLGAFFRTAMSLASPATVMQLSGRFWRSYFDRGSLNILDSGPRHVSVEVREWPLADEVSIHELVGSLVAWMEAARAKDVRMTRFEVLRTGTYALEVTWR